MSALSTVLRAFWRVATYRDHPARPHPHAAAAQRAMTRRRPQDHDPDLLRLAQEFTGHRSPSTKDGS